MSDLIFSRKEVDSIDMYVSNDGKITALSVSGLAKLCGISHQTMFKVLNALDDIGAAKTVPKSLECLRGNVFLAAPYKIDGDGVATSAKLVLSKAGSRLTRYYAYESKAANDTAKFSYDAFADIGIDGWIKLSTGYRDVTPISTGTSAITMSIAAMEALHAIVGDQIRDAKIIKEDIPGVGTLLSAYREGVTETELPNPFLLCEYLKTKQTNVSKSTKARFAQFLVGFYRGVSLAIPEKIKYRDGVYVGNSNCYKIETIALLDSAWDNFSEIQK